MSNEQDIINTLNYSLKLPIDFASFNIAAPLPGSDIRERARNDGTLVFGQEGFDTLGREGIMGNKNVSFEKIAELRRKAVKQFYFRPSYLLRRLRKTSSLEHLGIQFFEMLSLIKKSAL